MKSLTIVSVKCIKPSSGIDSVAQSIFGVIGGAIGARAAVGTTSGGLLTAASAGASTGVSVINGLDHFFAGADELYIRVNGSKVWPSGKYKDINSQQTKEVGHTLPLEGNVKIQLWEYDVISADDLLGYLELGQDHQTGSFTYLVQNPGEGSIYEINIKIS
jgi:hypothetical protein